MLISVHGALGAVQYVFAVALFRSCLYLLVPALFCLLC